MGRLLFHSYAIYSDGNTFLNKYRCVKRKLIKPVMNIN
jgi:hypothetical protein